MNDRKARILERLEELGKEPKEGEEEIDAAFTSPEGEGAQALEQRLSEAQAGGRSIEALEEEAAALLREEEEKSDKFEGLGGNRDVLGVPLDTLTAPAATEKFECDRRIRVLLHDLQLQLSAVLADLGVSNIEEARRGGKFVSKEDGMYFRNAAGNDIFVKELTPEEYSDWKARG